ncbi:MAG: hypothetical protein L0387_06585 [Acidobacteria bacterium]|nr:hypothetical protein [Acidobacteriota bacterium]MCI0724858.1 hypothetical protein [Acidobacteriota bacterium]
MVDAAFTEAEYRVEACGGEKYPFLLQRNVLLNRDPDLASVYSFLLFLSIYGENAVDGPDGAKLFEDVCAHAAAAYFGGPNTAVETYVFGFPRRIEPKDFVGALRDLCLKLREGQTHEKFPGVKSMKDASLDIVAWKNFPDRRSSKLIAFGQCATGQNWWGKRYELQPIDWCRTWLLKTPQVIPLKMFCVPHPVSENEWAQLGYQAGVIFDRFRIAYFAEQVIPDTLRRALQ